MDTLKNLGELALGSRLKRLSEQIMKAGQKVYKSYNLSFDPKWFPVYYSISIKDNTTVMEIADQLGLKHPSVSQVVKELEKNDLIVIKNDPNDARKKNLSLSLKGKKLLPQLEPIWADISNALNGLIQNHQHNILSALEQCEDNLIEQSLSERVELERKKRMDMQVEIISYAPNFAINFKQLNEEWITEHFTLEKKDLLVLNNPDEYILSQGGAIIFAKYKNDIVGTCALIKHNDSVFELAKMAVTANRQGLQIGRKLGTQIIAIARSKQAKSIILETNKKLTPALALYKKLGFHRSNHCQEQSVYQRCDVQMELLL